MSTPYVTPEMIINAPTGLAWDIIPAPGASSQAMFAEQLNICWRATGIVNTIAGQVLRATVDTETQTGPDYRITIQNATGNVRAIMQRWPVVQVYQVAVSANLFPRAWSLVGSDQFGSEHPVMGSYGSTAPSSPSDGGQSILVGASNGASWANGRNGFVLSTSYLNGWAHCGTTQSATTGATVLHVDDVTGFTGAVVWVYDGASTEQITVSSVTATTPLALPYGAMTVPAGPGTLNLASAITANHAAGTVVSAFTADVLQATILVCAAQVMEAGITSITIQSLPGVETMGGHGVEDLMVEAETILSPYKRTI